MGAACHGCAIRMMPPAARTQANIERAVSWRFSTGTDSSATRVGVMEKTVETMATGRKASPIVYSKLAPTQRTKKGVTHTKSRSKV